MKIQKQLLFFSIARFFYRNFKLSVLMCFNVFLLHASIMLQLFSSDYQYFISDHLKTLALALNYPVALLYIDKVMLIIN